MSGFVWVGFYATPCFETNHDEWTWFYVPMSSPPPHLSGYECVGKCYLNPLCNTLLVMPIQSRVHMNLNGEWSNHTSIHTHVPGPSLHDKLIHVYMKHVTLIRFLNSMSSLQCYRSLLTARMMTFPMVGCTCNLEN